MPDATGLELIAQAVRERLGESVVVGTSFHREAATLEVAPEHVADAVRYLARDADEPFEFLASLHGCDYHPHEPRLGVHYQLLSRRRVERLGVRTRVGTDDPRVPSVVDVFGGANFQEREVYDFFGVVFDGHPDLRRILLPEDYEGHPQRRDFPIGGEPVLFTFNEDQMPRWWEKRSGGWQNSDSDSDSENGR
ncbi:MAG: NADH-quinone oxidoreductase subunit C [Thermoleophilaceae bacterium]|nr:NADH-quinone oxidoreductase subunit C [Thermoleophilaceae bacterium]